MARSELSSDQPPISEPVFVADTFVTGLADIRAINGNWRLSFFADRQAIGVTPRERIIVCHLVMTAETQRQILREMIAGNRELN